MDGWKLCDWPHRRPSVQWSDCSALDHRNIQNKQGTKHTEVASAASLSLLFLVLVLLPATPPPTPPSVMLGWVPFDFPRGSYIGPGTWRAAAPAPG